MKDHWTVALLTSRLLIVDVVSKEVQALPDLEELQNLLTAMAESEPQPQQGTGEEQTESGTIAWYLGTL